VQEPREYDVRENEPCTEVLLREWNLRKSSKL